MTAIATGCRCTVKRIIKSAAKFVAERVEIRLDRRYNIYTLKGEVQDARILC